MEKIEPALTPEEWNNGVEYNYAICDRTKGLDFLGDRAARAIIALANAEFSDSDPQKITRASVAVLRDVAKQIQDTTEPGFHGDTDLLLLADALESYLPPAK